MTESSEIRYAGPVASPGNPIAGSQFSVHFLIKAANIPHARVTPNLLTLLPHSRCTLRSLYTTYDTSALRARGPVGPTWHWRARTCIHAREHVCADIYRSIGVSTHRRIALRAVKHVEISCRTDTSRCRIDTRRIDCYFVRPHPDGAEFISRESVGSRF